MYDSGDPSCNANTGEYGMNRLRGNFITQTSLCDNYDTGMIWTTTLDNEQADILHFALFNASHGNFNNRAKASKIYYDGKNMTKLRMLSVEYYPAFIWLNDHCVIQYMLCVNACCDALYDVQNLTDNLCDTYVSKSIRFEILDYEPSSGRPTLLITCVILAVCSVV